MLRTFDAASRYIDQGAGKRPGAINMFLEPWHADIFEFLDIRKNNGKEEMRARDLFSSLWIPDLLYVILHYRLIPAIIIMVILA